MQDQRALEHTESLVSMGVEKDENFQKMIPDCLGCQNQQHVICTQFELVSACYGLPKVPNKLENGPFGDTKWVQNGSKLRFLKENCIRHGVQKQAILAHCVDVLTRFGTVLLLGLLVSQHETKKGQCPEKGPNGPEMVRFGQH